MIYKINDTVAESNILSLIHSRIPFTIRANVNSIASDSKKGNTLAINDRSEDGSHVNYGSNW